MSAHAEEDKPCRACSDFKTWAKKQNKSTFTSPPKNKQPPPRRKDCPLDKDEIGTATWSFLHSMVSYFPKIPTRKQSTDMAQFFNIFSQFYPCEPCALDFQDDIKKHPPRTESRDELAKWLCERHNTVNAKLGKPIFDCSKSMRGGKMAGPMVPVINKHHHRPNVDWYSATCKGLNRGMA